MMAIGYRCAASATRFVYSRRGYDLEWPLRFARHDDNRRADGNLRQHRGDIGDRVNGPMEPSSADALTMAEPASLPIACPAAMSSGNANGQALAYQCSRDNPTEALQAKMLTKDEARRIAVNVARLPELLGKVDRD
jgi:hypothetical protein